ncbi:MAG: flagellar export chaperone FliS [Verrucomicrobia bacterium]|nr:flagellar export chaperone FliS [Verrucomicrobiota bacterium]MCF7707289.1 flagellar export chaperone FliS [Verrucomicrobiota bacterium]
MSLSKPWDSYRQVAFNTATPGQLILMLYDGALRFLEGAESGFASNDPLERIATVNNNLLRAQAVIRELNYSLNMQKGGEFSEHMRRLYDYFDRRLQESNLNKDSEGVGEVKRLLGHIRDAWEEMLRTAGQGSQVSQSAGLSIKG